MSLYVKRSGAWQLVGQPPPAQVINDLTDVDTTTGLADGRNLIWDAGSTQWRPAEPRIGIIAYKRGAASAISIPLSTAVPLLTLTSVPVLTGRLYQFDVFLRAIQASGGGSAFYMYVTPANPPANTDLVVDAYAYWAPGQYMPGDFHQLFKATATGNVTVTLNGYGFGGAGLAWTDGGGYIAIRDIGPDRGGQ